MDDVKQYAIDTLVNYANYIKVSNVDVTYASVSIANANADGTVRFTATIELKPSNG